MANIKDKNKPALDKALKEIDKVFSDTVKKLEKLHQQKMKLIKEYQELNRQTEIEKIRQSIKNN